MCHTYVAVFSQLDEIIRDSSEPSYGEEHLAALTAGERTVWADARETFFSTGVNRSSLEAIERAAFVLVLDDEEYELGTVSSLISPNLNLEKIFISIPSIQLDEHSATSLINNKVTINRCIRTRVFSLFTSL